MTRPYTRHKSLPDYGPAKGAVGRAVSNHGGRRVCQGCGQVFAKKDAIGCYPTEYGHEKGLYHDQGTLRHTCPKTKGT